MDCLDHPLTRNTIGANVIGWLYYPLGQMLFSYHPARDVTDAENFLC
jgi:hypothetical protein